MLRIIAYKMLAFVVAVWKKKVLPKIVISQPAELVGPNG